MEQQPAVTSLTGDAAQAWPRAGCTAAGPAAPNLVTALAGRFRHAGNATELGARLGAVSSLKGVPYWSVTDEAWRVLISDAFAVSGPDGVSRRADFTAAELASGQNFYFVQKDTRSSDPVIYRMRVMEQRDDRLVMEVENVSVVKLLFVPLFQPGALRTVTFLDRLDAGTWGYYALVVARTPAPERSEASFINRAVALYRHFIGVPPDSMPPLAR